MVYVNRFVPPLSHPKCNRHGQEISGACKKGLGGQWESLKWTVNTVLARGGKVKSGDVIITGILIKLISAKPGKYVAGYGDFGKTECEYE